MKIVAGLSLLEHRGKTNNKKIPSYLITSQIRTCTSSHTESPSEREILSGGLRRQEETHRETKLLLICLCGHEPEKQPASLQLEAKQRVAREEERDAAAPLSVWHVL